MATCYIAKGFDMPEFGLCNTTASVSLCCFPGEICLSNGYCSTHSGQIYSGACTDPTYSSSICPEFCTFATGGFITQCEGSVGQNGRFCCSMDTNGTCCEDPKNKLHMAPSSSSAIAMMPAITTAPASNTSPLSSITPSSTLLSTTLPATATASTPDPTPTPTGKTKKLVIGLSVGLGLGALLTLLWGVYAYLRRKRRLERFYRSEARCREDARNTANRAKRNNSRTWSSPFNRRENPANGEDARNTANRAKRHYSRTWSSPFNRRENPANGEDARNTANRAKRHYSRTWSSPFNRRENPANGEQRVRSPAESAKSESILPTASRLASMEHHVESQPPSELPTELPNSQIEQVESDTDSSDTDSAVDREPAAELEPETLESEQHNSTSQQPNTSNRPETLTSVELDGTSSPSPDPDRITPCEPTPEKGSKSQEPPQDEGTSAAKPAENPQVEDEVQRQWSWQHGDDEHLQRSLAEQIETSE